MLAPLLIDIWLRQELFIFMKGHTSISKMKQKDLWQRSAGKLSLVFMATLGLAESLKRQAIDLGFNLVGIIDAKPGLRFDAYLHWVNNQYHGEMDYLARPDRLVRRADLNQILPNVRSIVCVGLDYSPALIPLDIATDPSRGRISAYAWGVDYHRVMKPRLEELAQWLSEATSQKVDSKIYVDTGAILERDHAESAGLGFTGKNTMLIHPRRGSWIFLGELLTTVALEADEPILMPSCGRCRRCLDACPTNAFPSPYVLDARLCISYLTIELKGWIPRELRPLMGNWVYGCDICQEVCPFNRFAEPTNMPDFEARNWNELAPPILQLLALDEMTFEARYENSPIKRIKRGRLVRNACVAAGNWGSSEIVHGLTPLLDDKAAVVRGHAAWALKQIGDREAQAAIQSAKRKETDPRVQVELA